MIKEALEDLEVDAGEGVGFDLIGEEDLLHAFEFGLIATVDEDVEALREKFTSEFQADAIACACHKSPR